MSRHKDVPEYALIDISRKQLSDGNTHLLFDAWGQKFHVDLKPNLKLLSPHLVRSLENYLITKCYLTNNCFGKKKYKVAVAKDNCNLLFVFKQSK